MKKAKKVTTDGLEIIDQELHLVNQTGKRRSSGPSPTAPWHARFAICAPKPG